MKNIIVTLFLLIMLTSSIIVTSRIFSHEELDDVHPLILDTNDKYLKKSEWLWVIPYYGNVPISENKKWIKKLKKTGKKIGLHGVYHTHKEFGIDRSDEYVDKGINEFKKAFGYYPTHFKAPSLVLTENNAEKFRIRGIKIKGRLNQILHNVYHSPSGRKYDGKLLHE
jgi:predicted deacetylase